jgi:hypothetical protein
MVRGMFVRAPAHVDDVAVRGCAAARRDRAHPGVVEVADRTAQQPGEHGHHRSIVQHAMQRFVTVGKFGHEVAPASVLCRDSLHRVRSRFE